MIPLIDLQAQNRALGDRIDAALARVVEHGRYILGPEVGQLECKLAGWCGAADVVSCANGTDALELSLMALDLLPGQGVLVPTFTFAATAEAVVLRGGVPVFADVSPDSFNLEPGNARAAIEAAEAAGVELAGMIPVDLFGLPADYAGLNAVAEEAGLWVIADAAQSFGARRAGAAVGVHAPVTTTSFYPAKPLAAMGDAGAIILRDGELGALLRSLRVHGEGRDKYENLRIGRNSRLDTMQAAVLLVKLEIFAEELEARQRVAARYTRALAEVAGVPGIPEDATSSWAQYTVLLPAGVGRDTVRSRMSARGVPTAVYYDRPLHRQRAYATCPHAGDMSGVEAICDRVLSLPMHPYLEPADQDRVIEALRDELA